MINQSNYIIAFILLEENKNFNKEILINQLKEDWNINIIIESNNQNNLFFINEIKFEYEFANFNFPDIEILINYNDIDLESKNKILNHKTFLSFKVNSENKNFYEIALTFSKVCYSIIKQDIVSGTLIGEINLLITNFIYLFEMNEYIKDNNYFPSRLYIRIDVFSDHNGNHAFTEGIRNFGKYEIMAYNTLRDAGSIINILYILSRNIIENKFNIEDGNSMQIEDNSICIFKFFDNKFIMLEKFLK